MTTRDVRNYRGRCLRFFDDPRLVVIRKTATSPRSRDHFQPTNAVRLRLKRMVKRRHKPISDSEIAHPRPSPACGKGGITTPLTVNRGSATKLSVLCTKTRHTAEVLSAK